MDLRGWRAWSIAAYLMSYLLEDFVIDAFQTHFGTGWFVLCGEVFVPLMKGIVVHLVFWLILWWMYRGKIFIKI